MKIYKVWIVALISALVIIGVCGQSIAASDFTATVKPHNSNAIQTSYLNKGDMAFARIDTQGQPVEIYTMDMDNYMKYMLGEDFKYLAHGTGLTDASGRLTASAPGKYVFLVINKDSDEPIDAHVHMVYSRTSGSGGGSERPGSGSGRAARA